MKKSKFLIGVLVITLLLSVFCLNAKVFATDIADDQINPHTRTATQEGEPVTTSETEGTPVTTSGEENSNEKVDVYEGDLYVLFGEDGNYSDKTYVMDKYVDGNVFIFGQDVKITGSINGALYVFASTVTIEEDATIMTHSFIFADTIRMNGFTSDMYAAARNFEMTETGVVYRDLKVGADNAVIYGQIGRNVELASENINVFKDEETQAYVGGNLNYYSEKKVEDMDKITVNGEVKFTEKKQDTSNKTTISDYISDGIGEAIFAVAIYALFMFLAPKFVQKSKEYVSTKGLLAVAIGLGFTVLVPIIAFLLIFTIIGVPISLIMFAIYILALILNSVVVSVVANEFIVDKIPAIDTIWKKILMIIPVSLVLFLVKKLPVLGGWIAAIVLFAGLGIIVLYQFDKRKKENITE